MQDPNFPGLAEIIAEPPIKRRPGRPRRARPAPDPVAVEPPPDPEAELKATWIKGFADGMKFLVANCGHLLSDDPVVMNRVMVCIHRAHNSMFPPRLIDVYHSSVRTSWRGEFERIALGYGHEVTKKLNGSNRVGKPADTDIEWNFTGDSLWRD